MGSVFFFFSVESSRELTTGGVEVAVTSDD